MDDRPGFLPFAVLAALSDRGSMAAGAERSREPAITVTEVAAE